jgi:hypothetical protein
MGGVFQMTMLNQYKTELPGLWESTNYLAEWLGGYLWVTDKIAGEERLTKMTNTNGNNITKGEFSRGVDSHGFDKACQVFFKLGVKKSTWLATVWDTIHQLEVVEDARWDDVCTAMAWIAEDLGL